MNEADIIFAYLSLSTTVRASCSSSCSSIGCDDNKWTRNWKQMRPDEKLVHNLPALLSICFMQPIQYFDGEKWCDNEAKTDFESWGIEYPLRPKPKEVNDASSVAKRG